ncbi:5416_t:CDS:2, partial [Scutellospora calospora]
MCLHVFCAGFAIFQHKTIKDSQGKDYYLLIILFLIFFPVVVIPIIWIIMINRLAIDSTNLVFLVLFSSFERYQKQALLLACVFILILSLTRNVSYYTHHVHDDFLATSTAIIQYKLRDALDKARLYKSQDKNQNGDDKNIEMKQLIDKMQKEIDEMKKKLSYENQNE